MIRHPSDRAAYGVGSRVTRHPGSGAAERRRVAAGELAQSKAHLRLRAPQGAGAALPSAGKFPRG